MQTAQTHLDLDDLLVALHVIGELKPGDKLAIYAGHITIHQSNNLFENIVTKLKRNYYLESKAVSHEFIRTCVESLKNFVVRLGQDADEEMVQRFENYDIKKSILGLENLAETYGHDINMVAKLRCEIDKLRVLAKTIDKLF